MTSVAAVIVLIVAAAGLLYRRKAHAGLFWLRVSGLVLCCIGLLGLYLSTGRLDPVAHRLELASAEFPVPASEGTDGTVFRLFLVSGELELNREKWFVSELGSIPDWRDEQVLEAVPPPQGITTRRVFRNKIQRDYEPFSGRFGLSLGWDADGDEFVRMTPLRRPSHYLRAYSTYTGIFPGKTDQMSAVRLFIAGRTEQSRGAIFSLPVASAAFLVIVRDGGSTSQTLDPATLFTVCAPAAAVGHGNIASFDSARELLARGALFPSQPSGILPLLRDVSPVVGALLMLVALGVFIIWLPVPFIGAFLGVLAAMVMLCWFSRVEFNSFSRSVVSAEEQVNLYSMIATASSPLWRKSASELLEDCVSGHPDSDLAEWAALIYDLKGFSDSDTPSDSVQYAEDDPAATPEEE